MTRQEFIDDVTSFDDLLQFCYDNRMYDDVEDLCSKESMDDCIWDYIHAWDDSWESLGDALNGIDPGYDWYMHNGGLDFEPLDEFDFERIKSDVLRSAEDGGCFEEDGDDAPPMSPVSEEQEYYLDPITGERLLGGKRLFADDVIMNFDTLVC